MLAVTASILIRAAPRYLPCFARLVQSVSALSSSKVRESFKYSFRRKAADTVLVNPFCTPSLYLLQIQQSPSVL